MRRTLQAPSRCASPRCLRYKSSSSRFCPPPLRLPLSPRRPAMALPAVVMSAPRRNRQATQARATRCRKPLGAAAYCVKLLDTGNCRTSHIRLPASGRQATCRADRQWREEVRAGRRLRALSHRRAHASGPRCSAAAPHGEPATGGPATGGRGPHCRVCRAVMAPGSRRSDDAARPPGAGFRPAPGRASRGCD